MRYKIFCIRDRAADVFTQPFFMPTNGVAIRSFSDEINRAAPDNNMNKHPEDFDLYLMGEFDDNTGTFEGTRPQQIAIGNDLITKY